MTDFAASLIRTYVPMAVGGFVAFLAARGINVDANAQIQLTALLTFLFSSLYYVLARTLESRWPQLSFLLGSPKQPTYTEPNK